MDVVNSTVRISGGGCQFFIADLYLNDSSTASLYGSPSDNCGVTSTETQWSIDPTSQLNLVGSNSYLTGVNISEQYGTLNLAQGTHSWTTPYYVESYVYLTSGAILTGLNTHYREILANTSSSVLRPTPVREQLPAIACSMRTDLLTVGSSAQSVLSIDILNSTTYGSICIADVNGYPQTLAVRVNTTNPPTVGQVFRPIYYYQFADRQIKYDGRTIVNTTTVNATNANVYFASTLNQEDGLGPYYVQLEVIASYTPTSSPSASATPSGSIMSRSRTPSTSPTSSMSPFQSPSMTTSFSFSLTPFSSASRSHSATASASLTNTPSVTTSDSRTPTPSPSTSISSSLSATRTPSISTSYSASRTTSDSASSTASPSRSRTASPTASVSSTSTRTQSATASSTITASPSASLSRTETYSSSSSPTSTASNSLSASPTPSTSRSSTRTPSSSASTTTSASASLSRSASSSSSLSRSASSTTTSTSSATATSTRTPSISESSTITASSSASLSRTETYSPSPSSTTSASISTTATATHSASATSTGTPSSSASSTITASASSSISRSESFSTSRSASRTIGVSMSSLLSISASPFPSTTSTRSIPISLSSSPPPSLSSLASPSNSGTGLARSSSPSSSLSISSSSSPSGSPTKSSTLSFSPTPSGTVSSSLSASSSGTASGSASQSKALILLPPLPVVSSNPAPIGTVVGRTNSISSTPSPVQTLVLSRPSQQTTPDGDNNPSDDFANLINLVGGCAQATCDSGGGRVTVPEDSSSNTVTVPVVKEDGTSVGSVSVPNNPTGDNQEYAVAVSWITNRLSRSGVNIGPASTLLEVNLFDSNGNPVTKFGEALQICIQEETDNVDKDTCLGYWDTDKGKWICEDPCLDSQNNGKMWCGKTDHLTSFALLLGGNQGSDPCGDGQGYTLAWISLGFICGAILVFLLATLLIEVKYRYRRTHSSGVIRSVEVSD